MCNKKFNVTEGKQLRDYCYVDDFVLGVLKCLGNKKAFGEVINLASGNPISIKEIILTVREIVGSGHPVIGGRPYRQFESMALYADISKANYLLDWKPKSLFKDAIIEVIEWYKNNE